MNTRHLVFGCLLALGACKNPLKYENFRASVYDLDSDLAELTGARAAHCTYTKFLPRGGTEKIEFARLGECLHANLLRSLIDGGSTGYIDAEIDFAALPGEAGPARANAQIRMIPFNEAYGDDGTLTTYLKSFSAGTILKLPRARSRAETDYFDHHASIDLDRPIELQRLFLASPEQFRIAQFVAKSPAPTLQRIIVRSETKRFDLNGQTWTGEADIELYQTIDDEEPVVSLTVRTNWDPEVREKLRVSNLWRERPPTAPFMMEVDFK